MINTSRVFFNEGFSTICSLSYTDPNGQTVSHSFATASVLDSGFYVGSTSAFSVSSGWFERTSPTVVLSGLSGTVGAGAHTITANFSEDVKDFVTDDLSLSNLTVSDFTVVNASRYTFAVTPIAAGAVSVHIPAATLTDLPNNDNIVSNTLSAAADLADPSVAITGVPASISGPTVFNATITFDENVVGFVAADISISGGSVTALLGSGAGYTASVTANGNADLVMSIPAGAAQDLAGNDNTASATVTATNATGAETNAAVAHFMQTRANALLSNQPDLAGFLRGGAGQFAAEVTRSGGLVAFDSGYNAPVWARLNANWSTDLGAESQYIFGAIGGHSKLSENLLIGGMVQFDHLSEVNGVAEISGSGWLAGPYFAAKLANQPLYFEGALLYGQTANTVSPLGTYSDSFTTERWLATLGVSGQIEKNGFTLLPFLDAKYTSDAQAAYTDSLNNPIAAQTIGLAQVSAGLDFEVALSAATTLTGGASGVWSYSSGAATDPGFEGGRARVDLGVTHQVSGCNGLTLKSFYDGIGAVGFESYGAEFMWKTCF
ncbi:MAG: hypothetical protein GQ535_10795 [Rhodobacteraceae bacterium]|nr:hypothetical protein [Paracoccaceae bacterium]